MFMPTFIIKDVRNNLYLDKSKILQFRILARFMDGAGFEPATSTMPTWRSFQADLPAHQSSVSKTLTVQDRL